MRTLACAVLTLSALLLIPASAAAQKFRVETDVFDSAHKEPVCQTLTLFSDRLVYDLILDGEGAPTEVTVFDMSSGRVVLLDIGRSLKAVITHEELLRATTKMKLDIPAEEKVFYFAANPKFAVEFTPVSSELKLTGDPLSYVIQGAKVELAEAARSYQEFADWSARLNALRPGNLPPQARIEASRELAERDLIPEQIVRTIVAPGRFGGKKLEVRSKHHVNTALSKTDRKRIERIAGQIADFPAVSFAAYVEPEKVARKK